MRRILRSNRIVIPAKAGISYARTMLSIVTNKIDTVLYIGMTNNLVKRVWEHKNKVVEGFTKQYNVDKLVYCEIIDTPESAIIKEKQLKKWKRVWKERLINQFNPEWKDLYYDLL